LVEDLKEKIRWGHALVVASVQGITKIIVGSVCGTYEEKWGNKKPGMGV
jgi:hypothetical protein